MSRCLAVLIIADALGYSEVYAALTAVEPPLGRPVNPTIHDRAEWRLKQAEGSAFVTRIAAQPKIWIVVAKMISTALDNLVNIGKLKQEPGDQSEFDGLARSGRTRLAWQAWLAHDLRTVFPKMRGFPHRISSTCTPSPERGWMAKVSNRLLSNYLGTISTPCPTSLRPRAIAAGVRGSSYRVQPIAQNI